MARTAEELYREALSLSEEERERLALLLHNSVARGFVSREIEQAWMEEIERREKLHAEGKMGSVSWDELRRELGERYGV